MRVTYGTMYGMKRTTVYFPEDLKIRLEAESKRRGISEAELIRGAVDRELRSTEKRGGLFTTLAGPNASDLTRSTRDEWLKGFGDT